MRAIFTKGSGKFDRMVIEREDGSRDAIDCPKQRIIPHDLVHYAVESTLRRRGFMSRVASGEAADFGMQADDESDGVERLVEVFQGDAWSGGASPVDDMLALYRVTCDARACTPLQVSEADMAAIRERIAALDRQWQALQVGQSLSVSL